MPDAEEQPGGERERARAADPLRPQPPRDQRADRERERHREERVARVEHRRVDHHARMAQQRVEPGALGRRRGQRDERRLEEHEQPAEEGAEAEQHGRRVGGDLAQPAARAKQDRAAPQRQQQHPQQQRALLRGPDRGQPVEQRRRGRGVGRDQLEGEVRAHERQLQDQHRDDEQPGHARRRRGGRSRRTRAARSPRRRATPRSRTGRSSARRPGRGAGGRHRRWSGLRLGGELRGALRHERVGLALEAAPPCLTSIRISRPSRNGSGTWPT